MYSKKSILFIFCCIFITTVLFCFCGCKKNPDDFSAPPSHYVADQEGPSDRFYTLREAYDNGMLTKEDLQSIAAYHESGTSPTKALPKSEENKIKEIAAQIVRERETSPVKDAKAEDYSIINYYGTYRIYVVFIINDPYFMHPAVVVHETIAGIDFVYASPEWKIVVWSQGDLVFLD